MPVSLTAEPTRPPSQVAPPFWVVTTIPPSPTPLQMLTVGQLTPFNCVPLALAAVHVVPSLVLVEIPLAPTATQLVALAQLIA